MSAALADHLRAPQPVLPLMLETVAAAGWKQDDGLRRAARQIHAILGEALGREPVAPDLLAPGTAARVRERVRPVMWHYLCRFLMRETARAWIDRCGIAPGYVPEFERLKRDLGYGTSRPRSEKRPRSDSEALMRFARHIAALNPDADHARALRALRAFLIWCVKARGVTDPVRLTAEDVRAWRNDIARRLADGAPDPMVPRTAGATVGHVRRFLSWLEDQGMVVPGLRDAALRVPEREQRSHRPALTEAQAGRLMTAAAHEPKEPMLWIAILAVHLDTAGRASEVLGLQEGDVERLPGGWSVTIGSGKRRYAEPVDLSAATSQVLDWYATAYGLPEGEPVFRHRSGTPVLYVSYRAHFKRWLGAAGVRGKGLGTHLIRHSMLTWQDAAGATLREIRRLAGHVSVNGPAPYLHPGIRARHRAVSAAFRDRKPGGHGA